MRPLRIRRAQAALALALVATSGIAPASVAADPPDRVTYSRPGSFGAEILTANPDGSDEQVVPLVDPAEDFAIPVWSPDHSWLLISNTLRFEGDELLPFRPAIVRPDGSNNAGALAPGDFRSIRLHCRPWLAANAVQSRPTPSKARRRSAAIVLVPRPSGRMAKPGSGRHQPKTASASNQ